MGQIVLPATGTVYVDTSAIIYHVERVEPYFTTMSPLWSALDVETQEVETCELALLEVLVKPLRDGNHRLVDLYRQMLLDTSGFICLPISRSTLETAAGIRAKYGLRTPDAIHAASAIEYRSSLFVTNDPIFRRVEGLNVSVLKEL